MQNSLDYQRGLGAARVDAKQGWQGCWMQARELADEAVYSLLGLSPEQQGYAAGLDEAFPGGLGEISRFLEDIQVPGKLLPGCGGEELTPLLPAQASALIDTSAPRAVARGRWYCPQQGKVFALRVEAVKTFAEEKRRLCFLPEHRPPFDAPARGRYLTPY